uniref:Uncharacterized protein n=1 Tax=Rhizophora mucronata TaxID=61149 RepID=A0A2P2JHP7_RHIMU
MKFGLSKNAEYMLFMPTARRPSGEIRQRMNGMLSIGQQTQHLKPMSHENHIGRTPVMLENPGQS